MQDTISQARKEGMISTGIDLFLAALPVVLMAIDFVFEGIPGYPYNIVIISGIFIALICFSVIYRLRALRKISMLSGIKAATLYRNCVMICICFVALLLFYPAGCYREVTMKEMIEETIWNLAVPAAAIYVVVAWFRINFSLTKVSGVMIFRIYVWLCAFFFALNILCLSRSAFVLQRPRAFASLNRSNVQKPRHPAQRRRTQQSRKIARKFRKFKG